MINLNKKLVILSVDLSNFDDISVERTPAVSGLGGRFFKTSRYKRSIGTIKVMGQFEPVTFNVFRVDYVGGHHYAISCDMSSLYWQREPLQFAFAGSFSAHDTWKSFLKSAEEQISKYF